MATPKPHWDSSTTPSSCFSTACASTPTPFEAHRKVREISLKRKASGGKSLGMLDAMKLKKSTKDEKENFLNAEKLLAFDPGNTDYMLSIAQNAAKAGFYDTVLWICRIFLEAEASSPKPDVNKFLTIKDVFKSLKFGSLPATRYISRCASSPCAGV